MTSLQCPTWQGLSLLPLWTLWHFCRECPTGGQPRRQPQSLPVPCPLCKGNHWRSKCLCLRMEGGVSPSMDWWVPGPTVQALLLNINVEEPWVTIMVEKWKVIFLPDSWAHFSVLPFSPGPQSNNKVIVQCLSDQPLECYSTRLLACSWGDLHFCHFFLIVPEIPVPLLGWDLLSQFKAQILLPSGDFSVAPFFRNK
jgi:hypothetical protein